MYYYSGSYRVEVCPVRLFVMSLDRPPSVFSDLGTPVSGVNGKV